MPIDPALKMVLDAIAGLNGPPLESLTPEQTRTAYRAGRVNPNPPALARVDDLQVGGGSGELKARLYAPEKVTPLPGMVFLHGGGWTFGDLDTHETVCRTIAAEVGCVVVSVEYRLAPEHKFPAAIDDAFAATIDVHRRAPELGIDAARLAIAGDSSGGNLAAATCLRIRNEGGPPLRFHAIVNPVTNYGFDTKSYDENGTGYLLTTDTMRWFWNNYLSSPLDGDNYLASPLRAESLAGLPHAIVATAEFDPLRDEGDAYAKRVEADGGTVTHLQFAGLIHEFWHMAAISPACRAAFDEICAAMRDGFAEV